MTILHFDIRIDELNPEWTPVRKSQYLVKQSVARPCSVDHLVWPSIFDYDFELDANGMDDPLSILAEGQQTTISTKAHMFSLDGTVLIFEMLRSMKLTMQSAREQYGMCTKAVCFTQDIKHFVQLGKTSHLLGYDIATTGLLSGLMNCGYNDTEMNRHFKSAVLNSLNELHLIESENEIDAITNLVNSRVTGDGEFFPYAIYDITPSVYFG